MLNHKADKRHIVTQFGRGSKMTERLTDLIDCAEVFHLGNLWATLNHERVKKYVVVHAKGDM